MGFDYGFLLLDLAKEAFRNLEASSSRPEASETSRSIALEISSSVMDSAAVLFNIKPLPTVGRRHEGRVIAKQPDPRRLPTVSDCLAEELYHGGIYPTFAGISSKNGFCPLFQEMKTYILEYFIPLYLLLHTPSYNGI